MYMRHLMLFLGLIVLVDARDAAGGGLEELVERSDRYQFVFKGTVTKVNAATLKEIRATTSTIIVKVDEVLPVPAISAILGNFTGKEITVQLSTPSTVRIGEQFVFFATSWMFGSSIAVREVGRTKPEPDISTRIADALAKSADNKLRDRLMGAELVVAGRVSAARSAPENVRRDAISEHDPHARVAVIQIESFLKGQISERSVVVLFPGSRDVMWASAPKFREGQEGISGSPQRENANTRIFHCARSS